MDDDQGVRAFEDGLRKTSRGRGVQGKDLWSTLTPAMRETFGILESDTPRMARTKAAWYLRTAIENEFDEPMRTVALYSFNITGDPGINGIKSLADRQQKISDAIPKVGKRTAQGLMTKPILPMLAKIFVHHPPGPMPVELLIAAKEEVPAEGNLSTPSPATKPVVAEALHPTHIDPPVQPNVFQKHDDGDETDRFQLGGPYVIERYDIIYVFREGRAPQEIIELRRVRAMERASTFGLKFAESEDSQFEMVPEVLFGGHLTRMQRHQPGNQAVYLSRLNFGRHLRKGDVHQFGLRYWVEKNPDPSTHIIIMLTRRAEELGLHLNFWGSEKPVEFWRHGPFAEEAMTPGGPTVENRLAVNPQNGVSAEFVDPEIGTHFGIAWRWAEER
jgi:hypothetical protein